MDQHLQHRRNILRAIVAGENSFEDAVRLVKQNPILAPIRSDPEIFRRMFLAGGNGGSLSIWNVNLGKLIELFSEKTRVTADFAEEIERASTDYYLFVGLKQCAAGDLKRPGEPNEHLRKWAADLLADRIPTPNIPRKGKRPHLVWRDIVVATIFADAYVFNFAEFQNHKSKPGRERKATCEIVIAALDGIFSLSPASVEGIWKQNRDRLNWYLPEFPEKMP